MKRKINQVGTGTLTISLPNKWVRQNNVKKGDEIEVEVGDKQLVIMKGERHSIKKKVTINVDDFDKMTLNRYLHEFYREGVEEVIINYTKDSIMDYKKETRVTIEKYLKKIIDRFIGMEVISQTKGRFIIESLLSKEEFDKIDMVQKRIFFLLKDLTDEMLCSMDRDYKKFHPMVYDYHDNIVKFIYYYLRLLQGSEISDHEKMRLFALYMMIDKMLDKIRHTSEKLDAMKTVTPKIKKYLKEIFEIFLEEFEIIHNKSCDHKRIDQIVSKRYSLARRIDKERFTPDEFRVIYESKIMLDNIDMFIETKVAMNIDKMMG